MPIPTEFAYHRLFVAIDLPRELREELGEFFEESRSFWPESYAWRFTRPEQLHFTLKFLGRTASSLLPEIEKATEEASLRTEAFSIQLSPRISQFRGAQGMRVTWIEVEEQPALKTLAAQLDDALTPLGFAPERRIYQAHLTLARGRPRRKTSRRDLGPPDLRALENALAKRHSKLNIPWIARELTLYESFTKPEGSLYRELRRSPFSARSTERKLG